MPYRIEIDRQALKALAALPKKVQRQIAARIDSLSEELFLPDAQQIKGKEDIWRIRSGSHRIAYTVRQGSAHLLGVSPHSDRTGFSLQISAYTPI